jgi:hypothetical protein
MLFGFAIAYVLSVSFGVLHIATGLFFILRELFWRLGIFLFCLTAIAMILESFR